MALRELLAFFGVEVDTKELKEGDNQVTKFIDKLKNAGEAIASAFVVKEVLEFAEGTAHAITQIEHTADALGITTEAVQVWGFAARQAGMDSSELLNMMGRLQVSAANGADGASGAGAAFKKLGVDVHDSEGKFKSADVLMADVADKLADVKDSTKAAGIVTQLFGRQGRTLLPFLRQGSAGVRRLAEEYRQLGGGYSEKAIEATKEFEAETAAASVLVTSFRGAIAEKLLPMLSRAYRWLTNAGSAILKYVRGTDIIKNTLYALGIAAGLLAVKMAIAFAPLLLAVAAAGLLFVAFDDIVGLFTGKDSAIGHAIDDLFGKGASVKVVQDLKEAWSGIADAIKVAWEYAKKFFGYVDEKAESLATYIGQFTAAGSNRDQSTEGNRENARRLAAQQYVKAQQSGAQVDPLGSFGTVRFPGESTEDARANRDRIVQQLQSVDQEKRYASGNAVERSMAPSGAQAQYGDYKFDNSVEINVAQQPGQDSRELAAEIQKQIREHRDEANRAAVEAIEQGISP